MRCHPFFYLPACAMLLLIGSAPRRADFPEELAQWYATDPPERNSDRWIAANNDAEHSWVVSPADHGPRVELLRGRNQRRSALPFDIKPSPSKDGLAGDRLTAKVADGWIVAFNAGEFGAALWWFSRNGERRYRISDDHVISFLPTRSGLLAVAGITHGAESQGKLLRLSQRANGRWGAERLLDLVDGPEAVTKDSDGTVVVVTTKRLLRINPASKTIVPLVNDAFWGGLYPNSVVVAPSGDVFIGMRHGVAEIKNRRTFYEVRWLLPSKHVAEEKYEPGFK